MEPQDAPLVSICATFLNSAPFVARFIEACLAQDYPNVEVVLLDDASSDDAEHIAKEYAARDPRVKYHKNAERLGIIKCLEKEYALAAGKYLTWIGIDDWPARDAISNAVKAFEKYPDAGAVMPRAITVQQTPEDTFTFVNDVRVPAGKHPKEWLAKRAYRGLQAANFLFAFFRREDALRGVEYFRKRCCENPDFPEELREISLKKAYAPDYVVFLEAVAPHAFAVSEPSSVFIKVAHTSNLAFAFTENSTAAEFLKSEYYRLIFFDPIYADRYPRLTHGFQIWSRAEMLSGLYVYFLRSRMHSSFFDAQADRPWFDALFKDMSPFQTAAALILSAPFFLARLAAAVLRRFGDMLTMKRDKMARVALPRFLLSPEKRFKA